QERLVEVARRTGPVLPPPVRSRTHDVGRVDDKDRSPLLHPATLSPDPQMYAPGLRSHVDGGPSMGSALTRDGELSMRLPARSIVATATLALALTATTGAPAQASKKPAPRPGPAWTTVATGLDNPR